MKIHYFEILLIKHFDHLRNYMQLSYVCNFCAQIYENGYVFCYRSQWPCGVNRGSAAAPLPGLWV